MQKIKLRYRTFLSLPNESKATSDFLQNAIQFLQGGIISRIWAEDSSRSLKEIKRNHPQFINQYNIELTELASFYLSKDKPILPYLIDRHQIQYTALEAELFDVKHDNPNALIVAINFFSKEYVLRESFGPYLLLAKIEEDGSLENETFMIELKSDFSICSYSN